MAKKIVFEDSFLVSGIMCYTGCGVNIQNAFGNINQLKTLYDLPNDAKLVIDAEPYSLGVHRIFVIIDTENKEFSLGQKNFTDLSQRLKVSVDSVGFEIVTEDNSSKEKTQKYKNWLNIVINLMGLTSILILTTLFPPSILLTMVLTTLSFGVSGYTARHYLQHFFQNIRRGQVANMSTSVTLGWIFSFMHTLYHTLSMPMLAGASMTFMCFIMPIALIVIINGMDEINRLVMEKAKQMQLQGMKSVFPEMALEYECYDFSADQENMLSSLIVSLENTEPDSFQFSKKIRHLLASAHYSPQNKNALSEGTVLKVKRGECFPVDCKVLEGNTVVDASLLNGEPQQEKKALDCIPAGAINLENSVTVYATANPYNSTVNKLLFRANRQAQETAAVAQGKKFSYLYTVLVFAVLTSSLLFPIFYGISTVPLLLQNITGVLFAICPCTIAIAHQLPRILALFHRNNRNIILRNESLLDSRDDIHTIVFDKTGTLTTGKSEVDSAEGISVSLLERVYLLEKYFGGQHPIARAICSYYEEGGNNPLINVVEMARLDPNKRGIAGIVQGKSVHVGNREYLTSIGIDIPQALPFLITNGIESGLTPIFVAEENKYQGVILIKHEIRPGVIESLARLKAEGKKIYLLTGDTKPSAVAFNQQNGCPFSEADEIFSQQTPNDKESFLSKLIDEKRDAKGICFVGDGLNDAPCSRLVSEKGGMSCAMSGGDKAAFFTDLSLNGSLDYLFEHQKINQFLHKNVKQNQGILLYGIGTLLAFLAIFSSVGIALSPLIPIMLMTSTTLLTLFNSYRVKLYIENVFDNNPEGFKQFLASDLSPALLIGSSSFLFLSVLLTTYISGGAFILPPLIFTAGVISTLSSVSMITALGLASAFVLTSINSFSLSAGERETSSTKQKKVQQTYTRPPEELATKDLHAFRRSLTGVRDDEFHNGIPLADDQKTFTRPSSLSFP